MPNQQQKAFFISRQTHHWQDSDITRSLITQDGQRKYLDAEERTRFLQSLQGLPETERMICATLFWTGCRISEALALTPDHISASESMVLIRSLKKRDAIIYRRVPVPHSYIVDMLQYMSDKRDNPTLFPWKRTQAWHLIKQQMKDINIEGHRASPRGLRHTFGVHAVKSGVPIHLIQKWLGHAQLNTTLIYLDLLSDMEFEMARKMWG